MSSIFNGLLVGGWVGFCLGQDLHYGKTIAVLSVESREKQLYAVKHLSYCHLHRAYHILTDPEKLFHYLGNSDDPNVVATCHKIAAESPSLPTMPWIYGPMSSYETFSTMEEAYDFAHCLFLDWKAERDHNPA